MTTERPAGNGNPPNGFDRILESLSRTVTARTIPFASFLDELPERGELLFRNIFQLFHDMIHHYIREVVDEYPGDAESIGFHKYDLDRLFLEETRKPFFADRLFSHRLVMLAKSFRLSAAPNKIHLFKGPAGSGKSTFLNNLMEKFEAYMRLDEGLLYELVWRIPQGKRGRRRKKGGAEGEEAEAGGFFEIPCPNHDNPFFLVPRRERADYLRGVIKDADFRKRLFKHRQYQWVLHFEPCTVCSSLQAALAERYSVEEIFRMAHARRVLFDRRQGYGLSVWNAGDEVEKAGARGNERIQEFLNEFFQDSQKVHYVFSTYAKTNQGVRALMDLKAKNVQRFLDLHGIISDEVHKVGDVEERIQSLFMVLMNPGDLDAIKKGGKGTDEVESSLKDRLHELLVPYVLDYRTEVRIHTLTFGDQIRLRFMPHVLENFGRIVVATRIKGRSDAIGEWVRDYAPYKKFCDPDWRLLKMELYTGNIPDWLAKEDRDALKAEVRKAVIAESEADGHEGISGRESLRIFSEFYARHQKKRPITMRHLQDFFADDDSPYRDRLPRDFLRHLCDLYDLTVLAEVKDSMYAYNEEEIERSILNYLVSLPENVGDTVSNPYLDGESFTLTEDFRDIVETHLLGHSATVSQRQRYREEAIRLYASQTLSREIAVEGKRITESRQFAAMYAEYTKSAREKVLEPYVDQPNFRLALKEYGTADFEKYDARIRDRVKLLFRNLSEKYGYDEESARVVALHVLDGNLVNKFK